MHLHTEWLERMPVSVLTGRRGQNMKDFSAADQSQLIASGLENLRKMWCFRDLRFPGRNYGATFDTLLALSQNDILYDTSYNASYLATNCGLRTPEILLQPTELQGIWEYPISFSEDWPGHHRHAQITACSFAGDAKRARGSAAKAVAIVRYCFPYVRTDSEKPQARQTLSTRSHCPEALYRPM